MNINRKTEEMQMRKNFYDQWGISVGDKVSLKYDEHQFKSRDIAKISEIISEELAQLTFENGSGGTWHMLNLNIVGD